MDMLVKLYALPPPGDVFERLGNAAIITRRALAPEKHTVVGWVRENFSEHWASEVDVAIGSDEPVHRVDEHRELRPRTTAQRGKRERRERKAQHRMQRRDLGIPAGLPFEPPLIAPAACQQVDDRCACGEASRERSDEREIGGIVRHARFRGSNGTSL